MALRAIRKCWHGKRLYKIGDVFRGEGEAPRHFVEERKFSPKAVDEAAREEKLKRIAVRAQKAGDESAGLAGGTAKKP